MRPNINSALVMVDVIDATRAYEANVAAINAQKADIGKCPTNREIVINLGNRILFPEEFWFSGYEMN